MSLQGAHNLLVPINYTVNGHLLILNNSPHPLCLLSINYFGEGRLIGGASTTVCVGTGRELLDGFMILEGSFILLYRSSTLRATTSSLSSEVMECCFLAHPHFQK